MNALYYLWTLNLDMNALYYLWTLHLDMNALYYLWTLNLDMNALYYFVFVLTRINQSKIWEELKQMIFFLYYNDKTFK
jgi:hypothetical protein